MSDNYVLYFRGDLSSATNIAEVRKALKLKFVELLDAHIDILFAGVPCVLASGQLNDLKLMNSLFIKKGLLCSLETKSEVARVEDFGSIDWISWLANGDVVKPSNNDEFAVKATAEHQSHKKPSLASLTKINSKDVRSEKEHAEKLESAVSGLANSLTLTELSEYDVSDTTNVEVTNHLDLDLSNLSLEKLDDSQNRDN